MVVMMDDFVSRFNSRVDLLAHIKEMQELMRAQPQHADQLLEEIERTKGEIAAHDKLPPALRSLDADETKARA